MISDRIIEELVCALSNDEHYLKNPINLPDCGHYACQYCFTEAILNKENKCRKCNKIVASISPKEGILVTKFQDLMNFIMIQTEKQINKLKSKVCNWLKK